jgi:NAD(P)-dependent dehydrogenase (short-subunit alcohol dehydrogenase family)
MIESIALPGLEGKVVVVIDAGDAQGPAICGSLIASGVTVVATGAAEMLPALLVDAGTGLPGELHYRALDAASPDGWTALAEWVAANTERVDGIVGSALPVDHAVIGLKGHLADHASVVTIGEAANPGIRSNSITLPGGRGPRPQDVGSAVAFLLSDLAMYIDGAMLPIGERPAALI